MTKRRLPGVEIRERSIRIVFRFEGKQQRERLCLDNQSLPPTPANIKFAVKLAAGVQDRIRLGTFKYSDYFPNSPRAKQEASASAVPLLFDVMDQWLRVHDLKASTRKQYRVRMESFWKSQLRNVPIDQVRYSDILEALAAGTWKSAKSRNNELCMIRGPFDLAVRDKHILKNPCDEIRGKKVQTKKPDPFTLDEANRILDHLKVHRPAQIYNFIKFMFFTGLRTCEGIALTWDKVDLRTKEMHIEGGLVHEEESNTTKTAQSRIVILTAAAHAALLSQRALEIGDNEDSHVFFDPKTGKPWKYQTITDVRCFWTATLKDLDIRYRRPYNMRHTYATIGLMSGAKPAFLAKQLGHSLRMFFEVYAKWISSVDDRLEMTKVDAAIGQ